MRHVFIILKWELKKIISNWRKTVAVFMLPAAMLILALNVFPILINYLNTGELSQKPKIVAVEAPESFKEFVSDNRKLELYKFEWMSMEDFNSQELGDSSKLEKRMLDGSLFLFFTIDMNSESDSFDEVLTDYFRDVASNTGISMEEGSSKAKITVIFNSDISTGRSRAEQFLQNIEDDYEEYIYSNYGQEYTSLGGGDHWENNEFNPFTYVIENRTYANQSTSRVIPPILLILIYYCVYSLTCEIFASERERGFLTKLYLTPIKTSSLIIGKLLTIVTLSTIVCVMTYVLIFFASWTNQSNNPESLIPFGLFLTLTELLQCLLVVISMAFLICTITFDITLTLRKMSDIMLSLQKPLIICIFEFFIFLFRPTRGVLLEYFIPIHNGVVVMQDVFCQRVEIAELFNVLVVNFGLGAIMFVICLNKKEGMIHILGGDSNAKGK